MREMQVKSSLATNTLPYQGVAPQQSTPRVTILDPSLFGAPYDFKLACLLSETGFEVQFVSRPPRPADPPIPGNFNYLPLYSRVAEKVRLRVPPKLFSLIKGVEYLFDSLRLLKYFHHSKPNFAHYLWLPVAVVDIEVIKRIRRSMALVYTMHNTVVFHGSGHALQRVFRKEWLHLFDAIVVHTEKARTFLLDAGFCATRIFVVEHPPLTLADPTKGDAQLIPCKQKFRILMWGALKQYKGVDLLIEACTMLWSEGFEFQLALVGKPFYDIQLSLEGLTDRRKDGDLITVLDFVHEGQISAYIDSADLVVFPYIEIDASGALMATIERERASIATDIGGFSELRRRYEADRVFSIQTATAEALKERLRTLMSDREELEAVCQEVRRLKHVQTGWTEMVEVMSKAYSAAADHAKARMETSTKFGFKKFGNR